MKDSTASQRIGEVIFGGGRFAREDGDFRAGGVIQ